MNQRIPKSTSSRNDVAVIVTTYEAPAVLRLALLAVARQTMLPDTVLVADDGSSSETVKMLAEMAPEFPFSLIHVWQPHEGFRAARSRNNAIHCAEQTILAFLDQDTLAHSTWLETHLKNLKPNTVSLGNSIEMSPNRAAVLEATDVVSGQFETWHDPTAWNALARRQRRYLFYAWCRRLGMGIKAKPSLRSGNFAAWRSDLVKVNGFDEEYIGWGQEDDDLGLRLYMAGVRPLPVLDRALVTHVPHPPRHPAWRQGANIQRFHRRRRTFRCAAGLDRHPHPDVRITHFQGKKA